MTVQKFGTPAKPPAARKARRVDLFPDEFLAGTAALSIEETGAYVKIICLIYSRGGPIEDNEHWVARAISADVRTWRRLRRSLIDKGKLVVDAGKLTNRRCESELAKAEKRIEDAAENGRRGGRPRGASAGDRPEIGRTSPELQPDLRAKSLRSSCEPSEIAPPVSGDYNNLAKAPGSSGGKLTTNHQPPTKRERDRGDAAAPLTPAQGEDADERNPASIGEPPAAGTEAPKRARPSAAAGPPPGGVGPAPGAGVEVQLHQRGVAALGRAGVGRLDASRLLGRWLGDLTERLGDDGAALGRLGEMVGAAESAGDPVAYLAAAVANEPPPVRRPAPAGPAKASRRRGEQLKNNLAALEGWAPSADQLSELRAKFPGAFSRWQFELDAMRSNETVRAAFEHGQRSDPWPSFREWMRREERGEIKRAVNGSGARVRANRAPRAPQAGSDAARREWDD